jgi:hypothetical protein
MKDGITDPPDVAQAHADAARVVSLAYARKRRRRRPQSIHPPWLADTIADDRGRVMPILRNVALALRGARELADDFRFDELQRLVIVEATLPLADGAEPRSAAPAPRPLSDADVSQVQEWLQHAGLPKIGREIVHQAIALRAHERAFHPIRDYLDSLKWDGKPRLDAWLSTYLGAEPTPYVRAIGRMFLVAATARIVTRLRGARRPLVQRLPARRDARQGRRTAPSRQMVHRNQRAVGAEPRRGGSAQVFHLSARGEISSALRPRGSHRAASMRFHRDHEPCDLSR